MTDPFDALRAPVRPVDPDPGFAETLRERLRRAVLDGGHMTAPEPSAHAVTPYLVVRDARAAIDFYVDVFGASRRGDPIVMDDGRIGHAELAIGDSVLMLAEEFPEMGHVVAESGGPLVRVEVSNVDEAVAKAADRGARLDIPPRDEGHGKHANITDPQGGRWMIAQATARAPSGEEVPFPAHGQAGYFTFTVPDDESAKDFYGSVLGWRFTQGSVPRAWQAEGSGLTGAGIWGGQSYAGWKVMYGVTDLDAALARVRAAGGRAGEPETHPYGVTADCVDNQGVEFWLWQVPAGEGES